MVSIANFSIAGDETLMFTFLVQTGLILLFYLTAKIPANPHFCNRSEGIPPPRNRGTKSRTEGLERSLATLSWLGKARHTQPVASSL